MLRLKKIYSVMRLLERGHFENSYSGTKDSDFFPKWTNNIEYELCVNKIENPTKWSVANL